LSGGEPRGMRRTPRPSRQRRLIALPTAAGITPAGATARRLNLDLGEVGCGQEH
jgi:hypothetical protein